MSVTATRCGHCLAEIPDVSQIVARPGRCVCGARAITRLAGGMTLVHAPGCEGRGCVCDAGLDPVARRGLLDELRLCKGGVPRGDQN